MYYQIIKPIGRGAFGLVVSAYNRLTGQPIAIKKIYNAFTNPKDSKRTLREIKLLKHFRHENILDLRDITIPPADRSSFKEIYIITGLMETDLHQVITSNQELSDKHIQYFLYQILRGLKHIHSANVLHRDLKPSNILVNGDCSLKICDFGMARVVPTHQDTADQTSLTPQMTEYVATRWYRAPEVILSWKYYTIAIDMWSVGCIFAELFLRKPLFPGKNYMHQITQIIEIIGSPSETDLLTVHNIAARQFIQSLGNKAGVPVSNLFSNAPPAAIDLLSRMLSFNPEKRLTVQEALAHPYLAALHEPTEEPVAPPPFNFEFENANLSESEYRELIYQEIVSLNGNKMPM
uniref:Mitogen-activated protein kinase n=1 Tax=Arcella intermedia TaxID=1963864 RepID=A0A6B2L7Z0_9EUKA